jgi:DNA-binding GntR family transcriptional regulator
MPHAFSEKEFMADTSLEKMQPIVHLTLANKVYRDLRELIISGQLQPGARLTLAGMASALGTSAMPVREAINKLAADEALEILPNKSVRVPVMTRTRFQELVTIRLAVEGLAVKTAAGLITPAQLVNLADLERSFRTELKLEAPDVNRIIQINKQFHFTAYTACAMPTLVNLIEGLWLRIGPVLNLDLRNGSSRLANPPSVRAHAAMLKAMRAHDGEAASQALAMDIQSAAEVILSGTGLKDQ